MVNPSEVVDHKSDLAINGPDHAGVCDGAYMRYVSCVSLFSERSRGKCIDVYHENC